MFIYTGFNAAETHTGSASVSLSKKFANIAFAKK